MKFHLLSGLLPQELLLARTDARLDGPLCGCLAAIYFPEIKRRVKGIRFSQLWLPIAAALFVIEAMHVPGMLLWHAIYWPLSF